MCTNVNDVLAYYKNSPEVGSASITVFMPYGK